MVKASASNESNTAYDIADETANTTTESGNTGQASSLLYVDAEREGGVTCHGARWIEGDMDDPINGGVPYEHWWVSHITGARITEEHGVTELSPCDYFMWIFPISQLGEIVTFTNIRLARLGKTDSTSTEILKFLVF